MSTEINTWLRAFRVLETTARESRGSDGLGASSNSIPRTTCSDVIAIAVVLDPYIRELMNLDEHEVLSRRWQAVLDDLQKHALATPMREYAQNRAFWAALAWLCVKLESDEMPLPSDDEWDALLDVLEEEPDLRNVGPKGDGPFKRFENVKTYDDLFIAQLKHLRDTRGADTISNTLIPRSTNGDVVLLADYWTKQFGNVQKIAGHARVAQRWSSVLADIDKIARKGNPTAIYSKNAAFWPALKATAIQTALADEAPSQWDLAVDSVKDSVKHLPENIRSGATKAAEAIAGVAGDVAQGVGKLANEAGKGLFSGFGTPLLVGAGLLGVFLISRNRKSATKEV